MTTVLGQTPPKNTDTPTTRRRVVGMLTDQRMALGVIVIVLFVGFGIINPMFFNGPFVVYPLLRDTATFTVVGLAQMCALSIGHMNLAVGRMAAVSAMAAGFSFERLHMGLVPGSLIGLAVGALVGAFTGWIIVKSQVNSFVVTLAMDFALLGLVSITYTTFTSAAAFTTKPPGMATLGNGSLGDYCIGNLCGAPNVPLLVFPALVALIAVQYLYGLTRVGRELLSTGASLRVSRLSGIPSDRRIIQAHTISGLLAGLAGIMLAVASGSFSAAIGSEFMIPSFLGPVLGGTLLVGGAVSVLGTLLGTMLTLVIRQGLSVQGFGLETLNITLGFVLLVALSTQRLRTVTWRPWRRSRA